MRPNESLTLYKRHAASCTVLNMKLKPEARRYFFDCPCPIWIVGRTPSGDIVPRQSTGESELRKAEAVRATLIRQSKGDELNGPTIAECTKKFLDSQAQTLGTKTLGQYKLLFSRFQSFCERLKVFHMRKLTVDVLETFQTEGLPEDMASTSRATAIAKLRCFLKVAYRREWIAEPMVQKLSTRTAVYEQKEPYSDAEVDLIMREALRLNGGTHAYAKHPATFQLLLRLMFETGMRVGDAIRFDPSLLLKGEVLWVYTFIPQKTKRSSQPKLIEAYLNDELKAAIEKCQWLSAKRPFLYGDFKNDAYLANEVYYRMQTIGERCGVADCRPHRLRDTFAVRKLLSGLSLEDVSRLLGHSSVKVTEAYYAKWVRSRKVRLERLFAETLPNANGNGLRN